MESLPAADERFFGPERAVKEAALRLYAETRALPIVCPHGHVDPRLFADPDYSFGSPADLFIIPDHYVFRMLYSQGIALERLGIGSGQVERDPRRIWQLLGDNFHLFSGTPSGTWLTYELASVFGVHEKLRSANAQSIYDRIAAQLGTAEFRPRRLFERFNLEVLCTTDSAVDTLEHHQAIRASGWQGRVLPTFRPDTLLNLEAPGWRAELERLEALCGDVSTLGRFISAIESRRSFFKQMGAVASDHGVAVPWTEELSAPEAEAIYRRALKGGLSSGDALRFSGHMLMEMARMSIEDGLVMQLHAGVYRNHNQALYAACGADKGADIPLQTEFTRNLRALLNRYGNHASFRLILFTLDESTCSRELAPLAGHYPALRLGPPWWFLDSLNGMARYFDTVMETAGIYNTAGFNDDTRAFCSIPARHDVWRRASANWVAGLLVRGIVDEEDARRMCKELACGLAKSAYRL